MSEGGPSEEGSEKAGSRRGQSRGKGIKRDVALREGIASKDSAYGY